MKGKYYNSLPYTHIHTSQISMSPALLITILLASLLVRIQWGKQKLLQAFQTLNLIQEIDYCKAALNSPSAWTNIIPSTGGDGKDEARTSSRNTKSGWLLANCLPWDEPGWKPAVRKPWIENDSESKVTITGKMRFLYKQAHSLQFQYVMVLFMKPHRTCLSISVIIMCACVKKKSSHVLAVNQGHVYTKSSSYFPTSILGEIKYDRLMASSALKAFIHLYSLRCYQTCLCCWWYFLVICWEYGDYKSMRTGGGT